METVQRMAPDGSPIAVLAQQGVEVANLIIVEKSVDVLWREPSVGDNDRARLARSEATSTNKSKSLSDRAGRATAHHPESCRSRIRSGTR
jgi:hypothetical protein